MKLVRHGAAGAERPGLLDSAGRVRDLGAHVADIAREVLRPEAMAALAALDPESLPLVEGHPQRDLRLGPCVGHVGKFIGVGLNYADHAAEAGMDLPQEPILFTKWTSSIAGPDDPLSLPPGSTATDWEVELGIVIGAGGRDIDMADALRHVAGYCVVNDISERDWQLRGGGTWDKGKGYDGFGRIGPWLVSADEIPAPHELRLWLEVDGHRYQQGSTATMVFGPAELVAYCSRFATLHPGDIIATGTPPGVGMGQKPPVYLRPGQIMRLGIDGLGVQTQHVTGG
ncbi:fumarylacetoacetate hydrolase family protein [Paracoccus marinaquae]|uniref:Fumarylacetoacetate hydrolase family protein n=1 Tax=Paracoccus marinaquae TaxID=2841926 RepID=A0ABS6ALV1_9RHOB|nr:fumarylacetoacetate hydrolase family protein [Paracoccus marinaquae]MBU3030411.1 fumarylacetoacetate hydrolase family protein [Paracoccus marinaquae]